MTTGTSLQGRHCKEGSAGTVLQGWRCRDGAAGNWLPGRRCRDGAAGNWLQGRRCRDGLSCAQALRVEGACEDAVGRVCASVCAASQSEAGVHPVEITRHQIACNPNKFFPQNLRKLFKEHNFFTIAFSFANWSLGCFCKT